MMQVGDNPVDFGVPPATVLARFECRDARQVDFLRDYARLYNDIGACCFVSAWTDAGKNALAGFVTFSPCLLTVKQQAALVVRQGIAYDIPSHIPCWLIGQLSRDVRCSSPGLGRDLLLFAINEIVQRAENGAGSLIVVDVLTKSLIPYYASCGFLPLFPQPENWIPRNGALRMYMTMATATQIAALVSASAMR